MSDAWRIPWPDRFGAWWQRRFPRLGPWLSAQESRYAAHECDLAHVDRPVFVCGLARGGSTMLLEWLADMPGFTSHRYSDYPLLWTPFWWNRLLARLPHAHARPVERAHRDRILVTRDSPEAFQELLWEHWFPFDPDGDDVLGADALADPRMQAFAAAHRVHVAKLVCARGARRYVAKGNYDALRIALLARLYPDARFVVPFRAPLDHVASSMRQDALYRGAPAATLDHIAARGHHEFGPRRRPVRVDAASGARIRQLWDAGRAADGWLQQWIDVYGHVAAVVRGDADVAARTAFACYEDLCAEPARALADVARHIGLADDPEAAKRTGPWVARYAAPTHAAAAFDPPPDPARVEQAEHIYRLLRGNR